MKNSPENLSKSNRQLHIIERTVRCTSIYKLLDTAPVVDEVGALLYRVLGGDLDVLGGGGVPHPAPAGSPAVAPADVAPESSHRV